MQLAEYQNRFKCVTVERSESGVLMVQLRNRGRSLEWGGLPHRELPELFSMIESDRENKVMVFTGSGDRFITTRDEGAALAAGITRDREAVGPVEWEQVMYEGRRLIQSMLDIDIPIICALNGPVTAHSELAVLCDVLIAAEHSFFQDAPHFPSGLIPGDSTQIVWPMLLGPNRGRYFLLTGEKIHADEAKRLGVVGEVLPAAEVLPRSLELAEEFARNDSVYLRYTRQVLVRPWKKAMSEDLDLGLALEGLASLAGRTTAGTSQPAPSSNPAGPLT